MAKNLLTRRNTIDLIKFKRMKPIRSQKAEFISLLWWNLHAMKCTDLTCYRSLSSDECLCLPYTWDGVFWSLHKGPLCVFSIKKQPVFHFLKFNFKFSSVNLVSFKNRLCWSRSRNWRSKRITSKEIARDSINLTWPKALHKVKLLQELWQIVYMLGYIVKLTKHIWGNQESNEVVKGKTIEIWRYLV